MANVAAEPCTQRPACRFRCAGVVTRVRRAVVYLFHELLTKHGFAQGNKRTAHVTPRWFLNANRLGSVAAGDQEVIDMCRAAIDDRPSVDVIEARLLEHAARV